MPNDRTAISTLVSDFAAQLEAIVRQAAVEQVMSALGGLGAPSPARRGSGRPRKPGRKAGRPAKRGRRATGDVDAMGEKLLAHVKANPGQRGEQIAAAMRSDVTTIRLPMKKLIAARKVKTKGQRRGMTYWAGGGGAGPGGPAKAKNGRRVKRKAKGARKAKASRGRRKAKRGARKAKARVVRRKPATKAAARKTKAAMKTPVTKRQGATTKAATTPTPVVEAAA